MNRKFTIEELSADLSVANDMGGWFEYRAPDDDADEDVILVDQYGDEGDIIKTYKMTVRIEEVEQNA